MGICGIGAQSVLYYVCGQGLPLSLDYGRRESNPQAGEPVPDPRSGAYTNFATPVAWGGTHG